MIAGQKVRRKPQPCRCPYCDAVSRECLPVCQLCGATIVRCPECGRALTQEETNCPGCGADVAEPGRQSRLEC